MPTISTYNDNSIPDDGSKTAANQVKFSTIKTDLTDPLKDWIEANGFERGVDVASASSLGVNIAGTQHDVTGTTTIVNLATATGTTPKVKILKFDSALTVENSTAIALPGSANITVAANDVMGFYEVSNGNWRCFMYQPGYVAARKLKTIQVFTSSGTYTKPANLAYAIVEVLGGGGGGGGVAGTGAGTSHATGGSAGGYARELIAASDIAATETVTIGAGGSGGAAGSNNGAAGGTTSFGALLSATGGGAGKGVSGDDSANPASSGGSGSGGDINVTGGASTAGYDSGTRALGSSGGNSHLGGADSVVAAANSSNAGNSAAANSGAGGGGAVAEDSATNAAGGNGGSGICIVTEFY